MSHARDSAVAAETSAQPIVAGMTGRRSVWREFVALWAFGLREYRIWQSYRVNQVLWLTNLFVTTYLFFLLGRTLAGNAAKVIPAAYGTNYMSFIVVGVTINVFINTNLVDPYIRVRRAYFQGTMDLFLLSPMSIYTPLLGLMSKSAIDDYPRLFFTFGFGMLLFGATFSFHAVWLALFFTVLFLAAGFGIGLLSASSFHLFDIKQGTASSGSSGSGSLEPISFIVQGLLATLVAGTYYPVTVLPLPLQWLACLIPHTYAFDALRRLLDPHAQMNQPVLPIQHALPGLSPIMVDGLALGLLALTLLPLGFYLYGRGIERARGNGTLTRWQ
ncbi:MAG TPA: ABC transporter permease [Candidatus Saccharimonadales bacterium]|nr:ABC transporter permease [Candidatus Saccharimonadales bacterium]